MADKLQQTIKTYDEHAREFADYFRSINASRVKDISMAFKLLGDKPNPAVLEIGCADGRDAEEIIRRTTNYLGFDVSKELITLAKKNLPQGKFLVEDVRTFKFPSKLDVVFAFASLIHLDRAELESVIIAANNSLNSGGIFYLSMKKGDSCKSYVKRDNFGERLFYVYSPADMNELVEGYFENVFNTSGFIRNTDTEWYDVAFRKI